MTASRISFGLLYLCLCAPVSGQIALSAHSRLDSLLLDLDTTTSYYLIPQLAEDILQLLDTTQSTPTLYRVYQQKGLAHQQTGDLRQALLSQRRASRVAHQLQDSFFIAQAAYRIGNILYQQALNETARRQYQSAIDIFSRLDSLRWVAFVHNAFGQLESREKKWDTALSYYRVAYDLLQELGLKQLASVPLNNIGDVFFNQEKYEQALQVFGQSLDLARRQGKTMDQAVAHFNIGQCWRELGRPGRALQEIRRGLRLARSAAQPNIEALGLLDLSDTFAKMKLLDSALVYLRMHLQLKDSLSEAENKFRLGELYVAYETEKAHQQAALRQREIEDLKRERQLNFLISYFVISLLLLALVVTALFFVHNRMKRKLAESELLNQKLASGQMRRVLATKQKDLTTLALEIARRNELFISTNEALSEILHTGLTDEKRRQIRQLIQYNAQQLRIHEDLEELLLNIEQVNADFFDRLNRIAPDLTPSERQLCALLRLNLSSKEIASIRNISPKSVEMARYRLRKKLPIGAEDDIYAFMQSI